MSPHPDEVWLADLELVQRFGRLSLPRDMILTRPRALAIYVPLTTQHRGSKYEVELPRLPSLRELSVANVQGIGSLAITRLERKLGDVPAEVLQRIRNAIQFTID
ncbi:MAG TPA: type II toxin-antitoxin system PemK/MazF family toxin [Candidatus Acidoferrum sp.]|jgi:mRNA interferase MazF